MTLDVENLYKRLNARRSKVGLSWGELAISLSVDQAVFSRMKNGNPPNADSLVKMMAWLDVNAEDIMVCADLKRTKCPECHGKGFVFI